MTNSNISDNNSQLSSQGLSPRLHSVPDKGGSKHKYLVEHRAEILNYASLHGEAAAMERWNLKPATWEKLHNPDWYRVPERPGKDSRLETQVEILRQDVRDHRREVRELKEAFGMFTEVVSDQVSEKLLKPLLRSVIQLPPELDGHSPTETLPLANSNTESAKEATRNRLHVMSREDIRKEKRTRHNANQ